jgi:hypothetical protein
MERVVNDLIPIVLEPIPQSSLWMRFARGVGSVVACLAGSISAGYHFVDPDLRKELALLPLMGLTAIGTRRVRVEAKADDGERPVVFVHGMAGHRGNFRGMSAWFHAHGRKRLYSVSLPRGRGSEEQSKYLSRYIDRVLEVNDLLDGQVDIVAHSRGGVIARLALDDVDTTRRVATLVTVGTPHGGTVTARYARAQELDELRPDSPVMGHLKRQLPWTGPRLICLWSGEDVLVAPPSHAQVEGATNIELPGLSHCQMVLWPAGWRAAFNALSMA